VQTRWLMFLLCCVLPDLAIGQSVQQNGQSGSSARSAVCVRFTDAQIFTSSPQDLAARRSLTASAANQQQAGSDDRYQLPKVADVEDPIPQNPLGGVRQSDPSSLLAGDTRGTEIVFADSLNYSMLTSTPWMDSTAFWCPPNLFHRPLVLEETNLERYGNRLRLQPIASAVHFFAAIPVLPYQIGKYPVGYKVYTLHHDRPGNCTPFRRERFCFSLRGGIVQALAVSAIVIP
jgi:hypothetical protein